MFLLNANASALTIIAERNMVTGEIEAPNESDQVYTDHALIRVADDATVEIGEATSVTRLDYDRNGDTFSVWVTDAKEDIVLADAGTITPAV